MSTRVVVNLSVDVYRRAECVALMTNCDVADVVADAAGRYLEMMSRLVHDPRPVAELSDAEVLALSESCLEPRVDQRLSALLERQRESEITADERSELADLMKLYREGTLRKAEALSEAVGRGVRARLDA